MGSNFAHLLMSVLSIMSILRRIIYSKPLQKFFYPFARAFLRLFRKEYIIMCIDGGICSQIHFYLIGCYFQERGYKVAYNMQWYSISGMDTDGVFVRNFDLLRLFPSLHFHEIRSRFLLVLYRMFFTSKYRYDADKMSACLWREEKAPCYFPGYFHDFPELFTHLFSRYFSFDDAVQCLSQDNLTILSQIREKTCGAVHVRRGDLSHYSEVYGMPCTEEYFSQGVEYLLHRGVERFFLFSDEPEWCRKNLLHCLPDAAEYIIVSQNGSERGYMDLVLMAACSHTITSKGSLGKYSACLRNIPQRIVVCRDDATEHFWKGVFTNIVFL